MRHLWTGMAAGAALALTLAGCKSDPTDPLEAVAPNAVWEVVEIAGKPVPKDIEVTLTHPEAGLIAGRSGCNHYNGRISEQDGRVRIGELAGTRMACPGPVMAVEQAFRSAIARVDAVEIRDDRLELMAGGKPMVIATP
ncbi:putative lipoprotein [Thioclava dalianensis]|nr:META domain-containing protein [Thioclava dalianensis]SFM74540.1 putative lipoprotein [Thioclava dalianensis]